jgi:hypothetical protein
MLPINSLKDCTWGHRGRLRSEGREGYGSIYLPHWSLIELLLGLLVERLKPHQDTPARYGISQIKGRKDMRERWCKLMNLLDMTENKLFVPFRVCHRTTPKMNILKW